MPVLARRGPQVNKFEQISSIGHQMSLGGGPCTVRSHGGGQGRDGSCVSKVSRRVEGAGLRPVGTLYGEVQCVMDNVTCVPDPRVQTDTTENIFFPQLRWRGVNM